MPMDVAQDAPYYLITCAWMEEQNDSEVRCCCCSQRTETWPVSPAIVALSSVLYPTLHIAVVHLRVSLCYFCCR